jgi:iron complex outermembrane recepter protein
MRGFPLLHSMSVMYQPLSSPARRRTPLHLALALAFPCASGLVAAQATLEPVVITGSVSAQSAAQAPYAITVVDQDTLRSAGPQINLSESMSRVPGLVVANRNNYAQDLQISSRGFGARSGFGVRGIRLYTDGIPASMPDGQGQVSHFDLAGAQRIEVLRGPFSVLYGNSSGGVIALVSAEPKETVIDGTVDVGSYGLRQVRLGVAGELGNGFTLRGTVSGLEVDGFRPHSAARRTAANVRLGWAGEADRVVVIVNSLDQPADDPLGLDRAQFDADPYQTTPQATQFDTRKTARQLQVGANWRHAFDWGPLSSSQVTAYQGKRSVAQWLAIAPGTQNNVRHGGGVIDFDRDYQGLDARLNFGWDTLDVVVGGAYETSTDARQGFENYTGTGAAQVLGVTGRLRRDETNEAKTTDGYAQFEWRFAPAWVASGGVRSGHADLSSKDNYQNGLNGDDSGELRFGYTNPVLGLRWTAAPGLNLHASVARGFESPTLGDLAYRPDGIGGFNTALRPQKSRQVEFGAKWRTGAAQFDAALFRVDTTDEIGVATNAGGRSAFQNVGRTRRSGAEVAVRWQATDALHALTSVTLLDAKYRDNFLTCTGIPCNAAAVPVPAGNRIAGTNRGNAFAELGWKPRADQEYGLELRAASAITVNDTNTDGTPRYLLANLRASKRYALNGALSLELLARIDNLFDKVYAGSVIVNDANGRFFEPGAPRTLLLSLKVSGKP